MSKSHITPIEILGIGIDGQMAGLKSEQAYIDYTNIHFSGFGDIEKNFWSEELLHLFQIDKTKMPKIVSPWDISC